MVLGRIIYTKKKHIIVSLPEAHRLYKNNSMYFSNIYVYLWKVTLFNIQLFMGNKYYLTVLSHLDVWVNLYWEKITNLLFIHWSMLAYFSKT